MKQKEFELKAQQMGLTDSSVDSYVKTQMAIFEKEQKIHAEKEAKLLGTAIQALLPDIYNGTRAIPNCFLRGALFGMVRKGRRALVGNMPIVTMSQYDLTFTGYELDQNDLELWDTLIYLAKNRKVKNELRLSMYELLQYLRLQRTGQNIEAIKNRISRLQAGQVKIKRDKQEFGGSLINNYYIDTLGDGKLVIEYNKKLTHLFVENEHTFISVDIRHLLGDNQLARWLYNFYESHKKPMSFAIDFIQKLCRSTTEIKGFKQKLKLALELIKKAYFAVDQKSKWDHEITKNNFLIIYPNGKPKKQLQFNNIVKIL